MTADTIRLFAAYNTKVNIEMNGIISRLTYDEWNSRFGGHHPSIHSLCAHIYETDFMWLSRFCSLRHFNYCKNPLFDGSSRDGSPFDAVDEYMEKRTELDRVFEEFSREVENDDFGRILSFGGNAEDEHSSGFGVMVLHCFNHQTHHRGMIAMCLDAMGKENDFSDMFRPG